MQKEQILVLTYITMITLQVLYLILHLKSEPSMTYIRSGSHQQPQFRSAANPFLFGLS